MLFYGTLKTLINKYNNLSKEKGREEGIFYLKDIITEEIVQTYNDYKALFNNLIVR